MATGPRTGLSRTRTSTSWSTSATTSTSTTRTAASPTGNTSRQHTLGLDQLRTLEDYRNRHAQYKTDPALRAAHAAFPWIVTWDDHETENNYAGSVDEIDDTGARHQTPQQFAAQRAAAYQAYYEHMPIRARPAARQRRPADLPPVRLRSAGPPQRARHPAVPHRPARGFAGDFGPPAAGAGNTDRHADRRGPGALAGRRAARLAGPVERRRAAGDDEPHPVPQPGAVPPAIANLDQWDGYAPQRDAAARPPGRPPRGEPGRARRRHPLDLVQRTARELRPPGRRRRSRSSSCRRRSAPISRSPSTPRSRRPTRCFNPHVRYFDGLKRGLPAVRRGPARVAYGRTDRGHD